MNRLMTCFSIATFSTFSLLATSALSATKIGVVGAVDDAVIVVGEDGIERKVKLGDDIFANDTIKTDGNGKAQLIFEDRSTINVNENSEIKIDTYIYNPEQSSGQMAMNSVKGTFRFIGGALSKKQPVKITTPVATIGIRGGIVDTFVSPEGETDAVFVYGDQLSITNAEGQTSVTNTIGTGFSLDTPGALPAPLPPTQVAGLLENFVTTGGNGGGVENRPDSATVNDGVQRLNTDRATPLPPSTGGTPTGGLPNTNNTLAQSAQPPSTESSPVSAPAPADTQAPAPIVIVADENASVMQLSTVSLDSSMQQRTGQIQEAVQDPNKLLTIADQQSIINNYNQNQTFQQTLNNVGTRGQLAGILPPPPPSGNAGTLPPPPPGTAPVGSTPIAGSNPTAPINIGGATPPPPPTEIFTTVTDRRGGFTILRDINADGKLDIQNEGNTVVTEQSANFYKVNFISTSGGANRTMIVPKLQSVGFSPDTSINVDDSGTLVNRTVAGYKTKEGSMSLYNIERGGTNDLLDKENNFVIGRTIFEDTATASDQVDFYNAAERTKNATNNGASSLHGAATNGIAFYDFAPNVGKEVTGFEGGAFNYNRANAGFTDGRPVAEQTKFGVAVDWNNRSGAVGNMFSGQVNWLPVNGKSSATASYLRNDNPASSSASNDYNFTGKQLSYNGINVGGTPTFTSGGNTSYKGLAVGGNIYSTATSPVEGGMIDYVKPTVASGATASGSVHGLFALPDASKEVQGSQGFVLKENAIGAGLANGATALHHANSDKRGFASGVIMRNQTGSYKPAIYSNRATEINDVNFTTTNDGRIAGSIAVDDHLPTGTAGANYASASFSSSDSVYINDKLYTSRQSSAQSTYGGTGSGINNEGFVVSAGLVNNGQQAIDSTYHCNDCSYTHWGVWAGKLGNNITSPGAGNEDYASMVPYVVGEVTDAANLPSVGTANYRGEAYATVYNGNTGVQTNPENIAGKMAATVDFTNRQLQNFELDFGTVQGQPLHLRNMETAGIAATGDAVFQGTINPSAGVKLQSAAGLPGSAGGYMNGALYGPSGEEIGGNYVIGRDGGLKGGGVYLGKQR